MAVTGDRITFWFGCNILRHAEIIRLSILLLEKVGFDVSAAGGPAYCCGTSYDGQPHAASAMSARTVSRFNDVATKEGRGTVVTWCPSCHMHMSDIMAPGNPTSFDVTHITELLTSRADRLAPLLTHRVERRILLHRHIGFATHVAVNEGVHGLLAAIPGLEIVDGPAVPGHMCSALEAVPGALAKAAQETWDAASANGCDTLTTIFHSCHRAMAPTDGRQGVALRNWVHLVAESMGLPAGDAYRDWRKGGTPDVSAIERAGEKYYEQLVEPELRKAPVVT